LSRKAHEGVAIYNQTIEVQVEFSNSNFYFEGGNADSREFFKTWDKKIGGWNLREQFFREYYVSSNIFYYRVDKELNLADMGRRRLLRLDNKVPIKYILLDPAEIHCDNALNFIDTDYYQLLNDYQVKRLKDPKTEAEIEFKNSLPAEVQKQINQGLGKVKVKLDKEKTHTVFVKKQDYQGLSVPMYYSVLADIDLKL